MANSDAHLRSIARTIERDLAAAYGAQWRACFPPSVRDALVNARILAVILSQALPSYAPAQELARDLIRHTAGTN